MNRPHLSVIWRFVYVAGSLCDCVLLDDLVNLRPNAEHISLSILPPTTLTVSAFDPSSTQAVSSIRALRGHIRKGQCSKLKHLSEAGALQAVRDLTEPQVPLRLARSDKGIWCYHICRAVHKVFSKHAQGAPMHMLQAWTGPQGMVKQRDTEGWEASRAR